MTRLLVPAILALTALPAAAQDANGLTFGGEVKLEYLDTAGSHLWAFDGDVSASWRSGGLLGFDASVDTTYLDSSGGGQDLTNIWAALVLSTGAGEFAVGAPRPLVDTLGVMPKFSSSRVLDLQTSFLRGPITSIVSASDHGVTPGVTWKQNSGNLTFGAGYHHLNDGANVDILEGVMRYQAGDTTFFITGEFADVDGPNVTLMQIGAFHDADRFDFGAALSQLDLLDATRSLRLYGSFDVMPALTVRGDALLIQDTNDIYSLSATYRMDNGLFIEGGGSKITGSDEIYDIGVGFKF
ncbi:porin [Tabrizicola sp.]|uniref:porin n=1 Tax=Tabrizicola sp. TaxID=2005166 RepID=UPI002FDD3A0A